jgi:cysteine desulfurase
MDMFKKSRVYLDYAAATPLSKEAFSAMKPYLTESFANASAIHKEGVVARQAVEEARARVAAALQVRPEFVTFTSGGTESNNLAIIGTIEYLADKGWPLEEAEVVTTQIEHPSVINTMKALEAQGVVVKYVGVDSEGFVKIEELKKILSDKTVFFSVAYAK